jgi:hypothetical protein
VAAASSSAGRAADEGASASNASRIESRSSSSEAAVAAFNVANESAAARPMSGAFSSVMPSCPGLVGLATTSAFSCAMLSAGRSTGTGAGRFVSSSGAVVSPSSSRRESISTRSTLKARGTIWS